MMLYKKTDKKLSPLFFLVLSLLLLTLSCLKKKQSPYVNYDLKKTLRYPLGAEPPTLDWNKSTDTTSSLVIQNIMEGLIEYDFSEDVVKIQGALAHTWTSSSNYKTWTFFIRDQAVWSDGVVLKAEHFIGGWERLLNPKTGAEYAYFLFPIKNARAYHEGRIKDFQEVGIQKGPKGELIVSLEKSLSYFPQLLTHPSTYPIRNDIIKTKKSLWTHPKNLVTVGPYQLTRWDHDRALILKKNSRYHGKKPQIEQVILYIIPEETTLLNLFTSGRLDVATPLPSRELSLLKKRKGYQSYPLLSLYYYGFNLESPALKDVAVRKAIAHSIDRKEIVQLLKGGQAPLKSWIPQGLFAHNPDVGLDFNPLKAQKILKESSYFRSSKPRSLQIYYNTTGDHKMVAENLQSQLKRHLNLEVELNTQEWKTYLQRLKTKKVEIFRLGWLADYPDPDNFMSLMTSFSDNNHTHWKNKKFDQLVLQARVSPNGLKRQALYDRAQKILLEEDVVVLPLFQAVKHVLVSSRVKKYPSNRMSEVKFKEMEIITPQQKGIQ
ncbi:MAG: peptide ABC transporter substrate-binding protein [Bdellovibrionales bacterium]